MKNSNNIEELFREGLQNFEPEVDPTIWQTIESKLGTSTSGVTGSAGLGAGKIAAITIVAAISVGTIAYFVFNSDSEESSITPKNEKAIVESDIKENIDLAEQETALTEAEFVDVKVTTPIKTNKSVAPDNQPATNLSNNEDVKPNDGQPGRSSTNGSSDSEVGGRTTAGRGDIHDQKSTGKETQVKPSIAIRLSDNQGYGPLTVDFDAVASGKDIYWTIKAVDGDQIYGVYGESGTFKFEKPGQYIIKATLEGTDENVSAESMVVINKKQVVGKEIKVSESVNRDWRAGEKDPIYILHANSTQNNKLILDFDSETISNFTMYLNHKNGQNVFMTTDPGNFWDCTNQRNGEMVPAGMYFGYITYSDADGNVQFPIPISIQVYY